ncbi:MAG: recombination protein RecR [Ignavibacteriae bacterium]|nr:recombination protein RecR [Ignavibacteriota bacterium]MCB9206718.1 recombination protein RecR [Ignavibacteriales bacterium]MCB9210567.1 recombination protein RecR [Ignavibacteriales bacterium]MCB9219942.1 recombination protein RecR [Ignavibacteriales bacterium]
MEIAEPLRIVIEELSKLPSIGRKSAQRLALHLVKKEKQELEVLIQALENLKDNIKFCSECFNISASDVCSICTNPKRDSSIICVVEEASDVIAIENTNEFSGKYHVLGGVLSPLAGVGVEDLKIKELVSRLKEDNVKEIILALNPNTEGETTSLYLAKLLKPIGIKITRLARGIPIGGDLEFTDEATIGRAVLNRIDM